MKRAVLISILLLAGGCASHDDRRADGQGLGTVDGAYYDQPRDVDYAYDQRYVESGTYYYDSGFPYYYRPYNRGGGYGRWDHGHDHGDNDHGRGDHDDHNPGRPDHPGVTPQPPVVTAPPAAAGPDKPTYNDIRAGKVNSNAHQNVGGNRSSNSGHSAAGGGGKH